jgi:hypothetical protein
MIMTYFRMCSFKILSSPSKSWWSHQKLRVKFSIHILQLGHEKGASTPYSSSTHTIE